MNDDIKDTLEEQRKKIQEEIKKIQKEIQERERILEVKNRVLEVMNAAITDIEKIENSIEKEVNATKKSQSEIEPALKFSGIQKAKARLCQLGVAVKSKIPNSKDIKDKLNTAAINVGYALGTTRDNIENFTSEVIEKFTEVREKHEQKVMESKKAKETKKTEYENTNILNFNPRQPEQTKSSKLGVASKKAIDMLKLTNIDLKIEKAFLKADISIENYIEKTTDKFNNTVERIRSIPSNIIDKYTKWRQERIDKRATLQDQINELKGMKKEALNMNNSQQIKEPIQNNVVAIR